jgi:uncharacterized damage-inducible protein DinB
MTKEYFLSLAKYNIWANEIMQNLLSQISDIQWNTQLVGSMSSISATVLHIASAEKTWYERLIGESEPFLASYFTGNKKEIIDIWKISSENLYKYIIENNDEKITETFENQSLKGDSFVSKRFEALAHVFNHSSYHRGQLIIFLRQVGFTDIKASDLIQFYREQSQVQQ